MNFSLNRYDGPSAQCGKSTGETMVRPRTLREQLQDQKVGLESRIADIDEALDSLTPDVEKALNALQKL